MDIEARWSDRSTFAEVAEALAVTTEEVMAVSSDGVVLWTEDRGAGTCVYRAELFRDGDGIMRAVGEERLGTWEEWSSKLMELMEQAMREV